MEINVIKEQGRCQISMKGEMTIYTALQCKEEMLEPLNDCKEVIVDLSGVYEIDTSGLQIISLFLSETLKKNITVRFLCISEAVEEFMNFCGLGQILTGKTETAAV